MAGKLRRRVVSISDNYIVEQIDITAQEASDKKAVLTYMPSAPDRVTLDLIGGTSQKRDQDYIVVGQELIWDGYALETLLEEDDELRVIYAI